MSEGTAGLTAPGFGCGDPNFLSSMPKLSDVLVSPKPRSSVWFLDKIGEKGKVLARL